MHQQLGAQDAQFYYAQSPCNPTHVMAVCICEPSGKSGKQMTLDQLGRHIESRWQDSPILRQKLYHPPLTVDHPYWVEDEYFDLDAHLSSSQLAGPGDWAQFTRQVSRHFSRPMDMHRPLWDVHLLTGLSDIEDSHPESYAILIRIHHCAADGIGTAQLIAALCDGDKRGAPLQTLPRHPINPPTEPETSRVVTKALRNALAAPFKMGRSLGKYAPEIFNSLSREQSAALPIPDSRFNGQVSPHKVFESVSFPLEAFKDIKRNVEGATINDVALAVVGGGLRRYLEKHGELPDQSLVSWCPVDARASGSAAEGAGNQLSGMAIAVGTDISDPLQRLRAVRSATAASKSAETGVGARLVTEMTQHIPAPAMLGLARLMSGERFKPKFCNLFVSNVPGPPTPIYFQGAKVTRQFGLAPLGNGMGLFIAVGSYAGSLMLSIISDRNLLPDADFFAECLVQSFNELQQAIGDKGG